MAQKIKFKTISAENELLKDERRELTVRHTDLVIKNASKATYEKDTLANTAKFNKVFADYNNSLSQESTLLFLAAVEKNTGVWLKQTSLDVVSQVYQFGAVTSTNPTNRGALVYETDNIGISTTANVSYECTYEELKAVLEYLRTNGRKATITSMAFDYDQTTSIVSGTMSISFYAISGSNRPPQKVDIQDVFIGTGNIFNSDTFITNGADVSIKDKIMSSYDMYVVVNRTGADKEAVIVGQRGNDQATVTSNSTGIENVTIRVTGRAGDYKVSYQVGSSQYPAQGFEDGAAFVCGDSIELMIMSAERGATTDSNGISLRIINETDIAVNATIIGDDPVAPRVKLDESKGAVVFH